MIDIQFPKRLDLWNVIPTVSTVPEEGEILINLNEVDFAKPCGIASLAAYIEREKHKRKITVQRPQEDSTFKYLQNMDFFSTFKIFENENFERHNQTGRFSRMMRIDWESDSSKIAHDLLGSLGIDEKLVRADLLTCLEESINNLWSHAQAPGYAMAQSYERGSIRCRYHIAICDCGQGIRASLQNNPDYNVENDIDGVSLACKRGVSGKLHDRFGGYPVHFGEGLCQIDSVAESTMGKFTLCSGTGCRQRKSRNTSLFQISQWHGTVLSLELTHTGICKRPERQKHATEGLRFE